MVVGQIATGTEVLVIGAGPGGYHAAALLARAGKDVTLVEAAALGGVCLNAGCIPSKALIQGARQGRDLAGLQTWKAAVVAQLRGGVERMLRQAGVTVVQGQAAFAGPDRVTVATADGQEAYRFQHCIIATGAGPAELPGFAVDGQVVLDATAALELVTVPERLLVLGGGYIGLELGTAFARLGSRVTLVEALDRLLPGLDPELGRAVQRRLAELGVTVHLQARATGWTRQPGGADVTVAVEGSEFQVTADQVLVATGRRPQTAGLGLEVAGIATDGDGFIPVDTTCRTRAARIFAIGDVTGEPMLAHRATRQAEVAAATLLGQQAAMDAVAIPAVVFSDPEVATVGLTEAAAREQGYRPVVGRASLAASGRALIHGATAGFVKVVADGESGLLLGVQMAGPEASELIAAPTLALELGARAADIALTIHPHPTLSESLQAAAATAAAAVKRKER